MIEAWGGEQATLEARKRPMRRAPSAAWKFPEEA